MLPAEPHMPTPEPQAFLAVTSRFASIELVQDVVDDLLGELAIAEEPRHWIGLAVREAVANAIKHGNREDPDKAVEVDVALEGPEVVVRVRDEGPGFDPGDVADPLAPENILRPGGRGIFYMRRLMDAVDYRFGGGGGTEVVMRKRIGPAAAAPSEHG
jgi:serine/threonine-protein kinase RsbW